MTAIVLIGIELSARTQFGLLGAEIFTLALVRGRRADQGLRRRRPPGLDRPEPLLAQPVHASAPARSQPGCCSAVFIYWGWDTTATRQRGDRRPGRGAGQGDRDQHPDPARRSTWSSPSPPRPTPASTAWSPTRKTCSARLGDRSLRLAARQDPDHRRAHLGRGVDPDDDPADGANDALDGARRKRCRRASARSTPAS